LQSGLALTQFLKLARSNPGSGRSKVRVVHEDPINLRQRADHMIKSDARKTDASLILSSGLGDEDDGLSGAQDIPCVFSKATIKTNVD
jgi:hypothetical protein